MWHMRKRRMSLLLLMGYVALSLSVIHDAHGQKACPFRVINREVQKVFGTFDRSLYNGGEIEGAEIPNVIKIERVTMYSCAFQRMSSKEVLQFTAFSYPTSEEAVAAFDRVGKVKNADGDFYRSGLKKGNVQMLEGPGRLASYLDTRVVLVHWLVQNGPRLSPKQFSGSQMASIPLAWFAGK